MNNISNKLTTTQLGERLDALSVARHSWENGAYKKSNEELYNLLDQCFSLLGQLKGQRKLINELNTLLRLRNIAFNEGTALATKVVRYVFGDCGRRAYGYARVLTVAAAEKTEKESFAAFIARKGGIEEVRKQKVAGALSKAEQANQNVIVAEGYFATAQSLVSDFACAAPDVHPDMAAAHQFTAALLRKNDDGTFSIVYGCNKAAVVKLLLVEGGKVARDHIVEQATAEQRKNKRKARDEAVGALAA
jgi:hypothetical protein